MIEQLNVRIRTVILLLPRVEHVTDKTDKLVALLLMDR